MKKNRLLVLVFIVALSTISTTSYAQLRYGLRGEVGINKPTYSEKALKVENSNSFKLGGTAEFMIPIINFGIEGSLLYNNDKMDVTYIKEGSASTGEKLSITNHYIDIPVNLKKKFGSILPIKIYAAAGPYARIHLSGDDIKFKDVEEKLKSKSFETGFNLGLGAELLSRLAVGINYGIRLTDNYSVNKPEWGDALNEKKGTWSIQATFYL